MEKAVGLARDLCEESGGVDRGRIRRVGLQVAGSGRELISGHPSVRKYITTMRNERPVGLDPPPSSHHQTYQWRGKEGPG